jgi:hypothetical protein
MILDSPTREGDRLLLLPDMSFEESWKLVCPFFGFGISYLLKHNLSAHVWSNIIDNGTHPTDHPLPAQLSCTSSSADA